jgi:hypothetical protein
MRSFQRPTLALLLVPIAEEYLGIRRTIGAGGGDTVERDVEDVGAGPLASLIRALVLLFLAPLAFLAVTAKPAGAQTVSTWSGGAGLGQTAPRVERRFGIRALTHRKA